MSHEGRLRELGVLSLAKENLTAAYRGLKTNCKADGAKHFSVMPDDISKDKGRELQLGKLRLNARERKFH